MPFFPYKDSLSRLLNIEIFIFLSTLFNGTVRQRIKTEVLIELVITDFLCIVVEFLGGLHFTLSNRIFLEGRTTFNPGTLYAVDLAGALLVQLSSVLF